MTIARNDSRWTAYVLDELDRFERVAFENEMESVPEAEEILAEIRETVDLLQASREVIPITGLTPTARQRIEVAAVPTRSRSYARWAAWSSAAAVVLFGFITISVPSLLRSRQVSMPASPVAGPIEPLNRARPGARAAFGSEAEEQTPFQTRTGDTGGTVLDSTGEAVNESPLPTDRNARAELSTVSVEAEERAVTRVLNRGGGDWEYRADSGAGNWACSERLRPGSNYARMPRWPTLRHSWTKRLAVRTLVFWLGCSTRSRWQHHHRQWNASLWIVGFEATSTRKNTTASSTIRLFPCFRILWQRSRLTWIRLRMPMSGVS